MRTLITGAAGQVGAELVRLAPDSAIVRAVDHHALDVTDVDAVRSVVDAFRPTVILNAAAYTAVDKAESERDLALRVNGAGPRRLAEVSDILGDCRVIQLSTDYVFDGQSPRAYAPGDEPRPVNVYGATKLEGERAVLQTLGSRGLVVRTAWVYSAQEHNFLRTMLHRMRECATLRVVADQVGTPTSARSVAEAVWAFAQRPDLSGTYHWTDAGVASWYDFAVAIAEEGAAAGLVPPNIEVHPIGTEEYPTPARRPSCSLLDTRQTVAELGLSPRHWRERLRQVLSELRDG